MPCSTCLKFWTIVAAVGVAMLLVNLFLRPAA